MTLDRYVLALRNFIKDKEDLNRLLKFSEENTDLDLELYIEMALGFLNSIPPDIVVFKIDNIDDFPIPSLLIHQATIECLISNSIVAARNDLTYNNGGITVKIDDGNRYLNMLQQLYRITDNEISTYKQWKIALNTDAAYGGVASPYSLLSRRASLRGL